MRERVEERRCRRHRCRVTRRRGSRDVRPVLLPLVAQRCGSACNHCKRSRLSRRHRLIGWLRRDRRSNRGRIRCEVRCGNVGPIDHHTLAAWTKRKTCVTRDNRVRPIWQSDKRVIAGAIACRRCARRSAQCHRRSIAARRRSDRAGKAETGCIELVAAVSVVALGVRRINLEVVGRARGQAGNCHLMARDHRRIYWRAISVSCRGSVIDRRIRRDVRCPNDLRAGSCDRSRLNVCNVQRRWRRIASAIRTAN